MSRLYSDLADWWPLLSPPDGYAAEAAVFSKLLLESNPGPRRSLLELGSGGGNNALHMKRHFDSTLVDLSSGMLAVSEKLNPDCRHVLGDMRDVRLNTQFDCVFIHDAIAYMTTVSDLQRVARTAAAHLVDSGVALFVPDDVAETFSPHTSHGGSDGEDGRAMRYLEWVHDPDPKDTTCEVDYAFLMRDASGKKQVVHDSHLCGLFPRSIWHAVFTEAGLTAVEHNPTLPTGETLNAFVVHHTEKGT